MEKIYKISAGRLKKRNKLIKKKKEIKKIRLIGFKDLFYPFLALFSTHRAPYTHFGPVLSIFNTFFNPRAPKTHFWTLNIPFRLTKIP